MPKNETDEDRKDISLHRSSFVSQCGQIDEDGEWLKIKHGVKTNGNHTFFHDRTMKQVFTVPQLTWMFHV